MYPSRARGWRGTFAPALVLGLVVTLISVTSPAHAAVSPTVALPIRVSATSAFDSLNKSVTVSCPIGQRVYGAGGEITGGLGNVTMDDITPNSILTSVLVTGFENGAFAGNWSVTAYAICGPLTLNLQRIFFTSATNSASVKSVVAGCPTGLRLYGIGAEINGGIGNVFFDDLSPNLGLTSVLVTAFENGAFLGNWSVTGYAICANPAATMVRAAVTSASNSVDKSATSACPAGTHVHGVGAELNGALGNVVIDDLTPNIGLFSSTATGFENGLFAGNWTVTSYSICAS